MNDVFNYIKVRPSTFKKKSFLYVLQWKRPLKMTKNASYFFSKPLFVLKIFKFLFWLFGHVEKTACRKLRLILKFMTSQPG